MVYEFNVKLVGGAYFRPGVSRTLRIGGSATLDELARLILISVNFDIDHLYGFEINKVYYENMPSDFRASKKTNVKLYSIGFKQGEKFYFNFDYGDDWRFELKVSKALDESGNIKSEVLSGKGEVEQYPDLDEDYLEDEFEPFDDDYDEDYGDDTYAGFYVNDDELKEWGKLYELAEIFKKQKPWLYMSNGDEVEIILPNGDKGYFCVMGNGQIEYGFSLYLGEEGHKQHKIMQKHEIDGVSDNHVMILQDSINMWLVDKDELPIEYDDLLSLLEKKYRGSKNWIYFDRYEPGYMPYILNKDEVEICHKYLERLIEILPDVKKVISGKSGHYDEHTEYLSYDFSGKNWTRSIKNYVFEQDLYKAETISINGNSKKLRKKNDNHQIWEFDCFKQFDVADDSDYQKPIMPNLGIIANCEEGFIIGSDAFDPKENQIVSANKLLEDTILKEGRPDKIIVSDRLIAGFIESTCKLCGISLEIGEVTNCKEAVESYSRPDNVLLKNLMDAFGIDFETAREKAAISEEEFMAYAREQMLKAVGKNPDRVNNLIGDYSEMDESFSYDSENDEYWIPELKKFPLNTVEDKIQQVKNVFGQGEYDEEVLDDFDPIIVAETEIHTEKVVKNCSKDMLYNIASAMGLLVDSGYKKGLLEGIVADSYYKKPKLVLDIISEEEKNILKLLFRLDRDMEGVYVEDFPYRYECLISLIEKGLVDVECYTEEDFGMHLELRPLKVLEKAFQNKKRR